MAFIKSLSEEKNHPEHKYSVTFVTKVGIITIFKCQIKIFESQSRCTETTNFICYIFLAKFHLCITTPGSGTLLVVWIPKTMGIEKQMVKTC